MRATAHNDLLSLVSSMARREGASPTDWPQLTAHRASAPRALGMSEAENLALCCVLQGSMRVTIGHHAGQYDPGDYVVLTRGNRFGSEIVDATPQVPFLAFVLQIDPAFVRRVAADTAERANLSLRLPTVPADRHSYMANLDSEIFDALRRFLRSVYAQPNCRLAPLYLHEIVLLLLQTSQRTRLLQETADETDSESVAAAVRYICDNLSKQITVSDIARHLHMSPSTLHSAFRRWTGTTPYGLVTRIRLDEAQVLLENPDLAIGEIARAVGYSRVSHFSTEFRRRFGVSPRTYARAARGAYAQELEQPPAL